jgi:PAS domain S-box-containing protein
MQKVWPVKKEPEVLENDVKLLQERITELQAENERLAKACAQSAELFHRIFHASSNMMAIHTLKDGRFVDINEAAASMGGFKREELIGTSMAEQGLWKDPESQKKSHTNKKNEGKGGHNVELKILTKNGDTRTVLASSDPITINDEPCVLVVSTDITEIEESREYLDQIINCIRDPIFVMDRNHQFVLVNDAMCEHSGKSREALIGSIKQPCASKSPFWDKEEEVFRTGEDSLSEDTIPDGQGNFRAYLAKRSLLIDKKNHKQIVGVLRDITELRQIEAQLLQARKMEAIGVLAGGVAHDFNNLLNVINGYSEVVLDSQDLEDALRKDIEQIHDAGKRAAALTSQLLAFGRKQIMHPKIIDINHIITDMNSMLGRLIGEDIQIIPRFCQQPLAVNADPVKMQQVIVNLIVNARDAMPNGGRITIETAKIDFDKNYIASHPTIKPGPYVMLAIGDNGIGMDAETQARIFEPFYTTKPKGKGTGLGLSTVYGIVEQSNGHISVYSQLGKGTTVKIYLPRETGLDLAIQQETTPDLLRGGSETVLIAEDEKAVRSLVCRVLREHGYQVLEAADGLEALHLAADYPKDIHLVITDVLMPGLGGRVLVSSLQKARPEIRSLFISGHSDNMIVHHGILDPGVNFLQKPFSISSFLHKIRDVLGE